MKKILGIIGTILVICGIILIIGTVGADDYLVLQGKTGLDGDFLIGRCVLGAFISLIGSSFVYIAKENYFD